MQLELSLFLGVIVFGLLHGLNPSHGWIVATEQKPEGGGLASQPLAWCLFQNLFGSNKILHFNPQII